MVKQRILSQFVNFVVFFRYSRVAYLMPVFISMLDGMWRWGTLAITLNSLFMPLLGKW